MKRPAETVTIARHRVVTLSDGMRISKPNPTDHVRRHSDGSSTAIFRYAITAEDAEKLVDLVRHPTEEVADEA